MHVRTDNVLSVLQEARATNTVLFMQLGNPGDWGWNYTTLVSRFTVEKRKDSIDTFANDPVIWTAIDGAPDDGDDDQMDEERLAGMV
jgi:hypothetical protein